MKFGPYIIATLPDFRRHFNFAQFYRNRAQFVTDMNPDRVYYWGDAKLIEAYHTISRWILNDQDPLCREIPPVVAAAFSYFVGRDVDFNISSPSDTNLSAPVIMLQPDCGLILPAVTAAQFSDKIALRLHKIVANVKSSGLSTVGIHGGQTVTLEPGDVIFASECNGRFIELLPNKFATSRLTATQIDNPGHDDSVLIIDNTVTGHTLRRTGVTSFCALPDGVISIGSDHECDFGNLQFSIPTGMLLDDNLDIHPVVVKSDGLQSVGVLYSDGTLRTTTAYNSIKGIFRFDFIDKKLITNQL